MSARIPEHELIYDFLYQHWRPYVIKADLAQLGIGSKTIEHTLMLYGGQPPDKGYPPDWPDYVEWVENEVRHMRQALRAVVLIEFGIATNDKNEKIRSKERYKALHMSGKKYHGLLGAALDVLYSKIPIREKAKELAGMNASGHLCTTLT